MGMYFTDQYSLLHFAAGIIFRFWNINLVSAILAHLLFELVENTDAGMHFINTYLTAWPGGKPQRDSTRNSLGDTFYFIVGWCIANLVQSHSI